MTDLDLSGFDNWMEMAALITPWMRAADIDTRLSPKALRKVFQFQDIEGSIRDLEVLIMRAEESSVELEHVIGVVMSMMSVIHILAIFAWGEDKNERWSELIANVAAQHVADDD